MFLIDNSRDLAMPMQELITAKIALPQRLPRISRPRLLRIIENSLAAGTSTIISGRAGTGKTSLAVDFALQGKRPVAWYKIDAPDGDPSVFFNYLVCSIQKCRPGFGIKSLTSLGDLDNVDYMSWLADAFVYELAESETQGPLLIVIEDLHLVSDSDWLVPFFGRLLPLLPSNVHLLITSRNLPTPPLWRLRSKQSLVVIDEAALAFTRPEAIALFESYGLTGDQASIALDHTHGRAGWLNEAAAFLRKSVRVETDRTESGTASSMHSAAAYALESSTLE
jgi:ATP/maltotriose-dependent transcriptional regulator MalT